MNKKLPWYSKLGYGLGQGGGNMCFTFVSAFMMLYFTTVAGMNAASVGVVMMLSRVLDGISDLIMGRIVDRTKSKMGKARFWILVSSIPLAAMIYLLFSIPSSFTQNTKVVYVFIVYTLMNAVFYTMSNIAVTSLTALITKEKKERVELGSLKFIFNLLGQLMISTFTIQWVEDFGGGQKGWSIVALIYSVICVVTLFICVLSVKELPQEELYGPTENKQKAEKVKFSETIVLLLKNKYFILIFLYYLIVSISAGAQGTFATYYATYCLGDSAALGAITMATAVPTILILLVLPRLSAKYSIRKMLLIGGVISVVASVIVYYGGVTYALPILLAGLIISGVAGAPMQGAIDTMIASADDYSYLKFGKRVTATIFGCSTMGVKIGMGLGTAISGFMLEFARFDGTVQVQSGYTLQWLTHGYLIWVVIIAVSRTLISYFMKVEKDNEKLRAAAENNSKK